ncbi:MAG: helix-turn-helix domain-containing protein [Gemmatimonadales bacterium]
MPRPPVRSGRFARGHVGRGHPPLTRDGRSLENEILTIEEVAAYLRLTPQTIYRWAQEKRIPAVKLGKEWRFRKSIIDQWLDAQILADESGFGHLKPGR